MRSLIREHGLEEHIDVESAGTGAYHEGAPRDARSTAAAHRRRVDLVGFSQQFRASDFARFDYVLAMDDHNYRDLRSLARDDRERAKVRLARDFDPESPPGSSVPDPFYGERGFETVFEICEAACRGLLDHLVERHDLR